LGESRSHKITVSKIAKKLNASCSSGKGVDIVTPELAIEVETPGTVKEGIRQLQGFRKPVYIAGSSRQTVAEAIEKTEGTTIGVMDSNGEIIKPSTRKKS
jgi:translation initiation factor 1 (eIF-1/SUI1)